LQVLKSTLVHLLLPMVDAFRHVFAGDMSYGLKKCAQALPVLLNLRAQLGYVRLIREPHALPLSTRYPRLAYKWLGKSLSLGFSASTRLRIGLSHYQFLRDHTPQYLLGRLFDQPKPLWEEVVDVHHFRIVLSFPQPDDQEGDLALSFEMDGLSVCMTSFVFCQGSLLGLDAGTVIFVARMQGGAGRFEQVRVATQTCMDIVPADLLMAALGGLAQAFGVHRLVGVQTVHQVSRVLEVGAPPFFDYDGFWSSYGSTRSADGLHLMTLPYPEKPIDQIRSKHRGRTRRKREFKGRLAETVLQNCHRCICAPPAAPARH
jgi:uncharacterized protein VirK/YbjX